MSSNGNYEGELKQDKRARALANRSFTVWISAKPFSTVQLTNYEYRGVSVLVSKKTMREN